MRTAERILGTRLWYRHALYVSGTATRDEFTRKFEFFASPETGYGLDPRLLRAWEVGRRYVSEGVVHRVDSQVPGTKSVFSVATLLKPRRLSAPAAVRAARDLYGAPSDGSRLWRLPHAVAFECADGEATAYAWTDSSSLASRGDFLGFLAILTLLRESIACADIHRVKQHAQDLYATLPAVSRLGWVRPDVDLLLQCIEDMMVGIRWVAACFPIDWDAFREQVSNPKPWQGVPPWVVGGTGDFAEGSAHRILQRPVPLLKDVEPLWRYVRRPAQLDIQRRGRQRSFRSVLESLLLESDPPSSSQAKSSQDHHGT